MKKFILYWIDKASEIVEGPNILEAMYNAGYGYHNVALLDGFKEIK